MPDTVADGRKIVTEGSGHMAPGPAPAPNGIMPPVAPPAPTPFTPAAFLYVAKSASATNHDKTTRGDMKISDKKILVKGSCMDVEAPANQPAKPCEMKPPNGADFVNWTVVGLAKVMSASASEVKLSSSKENPALTLDPVSLNIPTHQKMPATNPGLHQSESKLLEGGGLIAAAADESTNPCKVVQSGDPVAVATGEVVDDFTDFALPGRFDVEWHRLYASGRAGEPGPLGQSGFTHNFHQWIDTDGGRSTLRNDDGRPVPFAALEPMRDAILRGRRLRILRYKDSFEVAHLDTRLVREFSPLVPGGRAVLRAIRDVFGNRVELVYEGGRLVTVIDTAKRELRLGHDAEGRIVRVEVWAEGKAHQHVAYAYDENGDLVSVTDAIGRVDRFVYDVRHRLVEKCLRGAVTFRYAYDPDSGLCTRTRADRNLQNVEFTYEPADARVIATGNPEPRVFELDARGDLRLVRTPDGAKASAYERDADGLVTKAANAAGEEWTMAYDELGHRTELVAPGGLPYRWTYEDGLLRERVEPSGRTWKLGYDHRGALTAFEGPEGFRLAYATDVHGRLATMSGPDGRLCDFAYDDAHNIVRFTNARGAAWTYRCDVLGRVIEERDPVGNVTSLAYDAVGRLVEHRMPDGTVLRYAYDALDHIIECADNVGTVTRIDRAGTGTPVRKTLADGRAWEFGYDLLERLREVKNPKGESYELVYDRAGRVVEEVSFDGEVVRFSYSRADQLRRVEFVDGTWIEYEHDERRFLTAETTPHDSVRYERNDDGNIVRAVSDDPLGKVVVEREWDALGRLVKEAVNGRAVEYRYDALGTRLARVLPNGETTSYFRDASGALVGLEHAGEKILFQRDALGREVRRYAYGAGLDVLTVYDRNGQVTDERAAVRPADGGAERPVAHRRNAYGAHARLQSVADARWGTVEITHGPTGMIEAHRSRHRDERFAYDAADSLVHASVGGEAGSWSLRPGNLLVGTERTVYEYDVCRRRRKARDRTTGAETEYFWDAKGQLREVCPPDGRRITFLYDPFGRRVRKTVITPAPADAPTAAPAVRTVEYVWDGDELAMEIDSELGERVFVHEPGTFVPVLERRGGATLLYVTDRRGLVREVVDAKGRVVWAGFFSAWGELVTAAAEPGVPAPPFRLLGQYDDAETGLAYVHFRYFDPKTARFLSPDPLGLDGGNNLFAFNGSPTEHTDPLGLFNKTQFQAWLNKFGAMRKAAADNTNARAAALKEQGKFNGQDPFSMSNRGTAVGTRTGQNGRRNIHAEVTLTAREGGGERAVGASIPHCGNCTNHIFQTGGVTASPLRSTGTPAGPAFPTPDIPPNTPPDPTWNGPPVPRSDGL